MEDQNQGSAVVPATDTPSAERPPDFSVDAIRLVVLPVSVHAVSPLARVLLRCVWAEARLWRAARALWKEL